MQSLIRNTDLKLLIQGISVVAVSGLLMGTALHPNLRGDEDLAGPQILMPTAGARADDNAGDPGVGTYAGRTPEYVIGTDWTHPRPEFILAAAEPEPEDTGDVVVYEATGDTAQVTRATWQDEPREPPVYPSVVGNGRYIADPPQSAGPADDADAG